MRRVQSCLVCVVIAAAIVSCSSSIARADLQFGGTVDSWEWTTDASRTIVAGTVEAIQPGVLATFTCRVTEALKRPKQSRLAAGDDLTVRLGEWTPPRGKRVLLFFDKEAADPLCTIWFPSRKPAADDELFLFPDMHGRKVRDIDQLLASMRKRLKQSRAASPDGSPKVSDAGFASRPGTSELDTSDIYFEIRVPPDEELRPMLEARKDLEAASILYRLYTSRSKEERAADCQRDVLHMLQVGQMQHANGVRCFKYLSFLQPDAARLIKTSPDGKFLAVLEESDLRLYASGGATPFYEAASLAPPSYHFPDRVMIFSADGKLFAHVLANGDVAVIDLAAQKRRSVGKLGWPLERKSHPGQFTFSPDAGLLALNMVHDETEKGSAVVVWKTDSGEQVQIVSKQWEQNKDLCLVGFDAAGRTRVIEAPYWKYLRSPEANEVQRTWKFPNIADHGYQQIPTEIAVSIPGLDVPERAKAK